LYRQVLQTACHQLETLFREGSKEGRKEGGRGNKNNREPEVKELIPRKGVFPEERTVPLACQAILRNVQYRLHNSPF
jgi:hypothetical protein